MNVLLLNLTRFGDLLQSQAAITDLVRQGHKVAVLCLENFAEAAALLSGVSLVVPLPAAAFLAALAGGRATGSKRRQNWPAALARLASLRDKLEADFAPDVVCNMTPSLSARMLARFLAGGRPCAGFAVDEYGFSANNGLWAAFLQGATITRGVSPFNVVDMFRRVAGPEALATGAEAATNALPGDAGLRPPAGEALSAMRRRLESAAPAGCRGFAAFQLGASADIRRWPTGFFAALGDRLWREEGVSPVLLGGKEETELARRYARAAKAPFIDLCGQTGLAELAAALCACRLLVTNDTGTMHYAAGLGVPVLAVFLATAQPFDTGPYRAGSLCVEPDLPCHPCSFGQSCCNMLPVPPEAGEPGTEGQMASCRLAVGPDCLAELALSRLRGEQWASESARPPARVWLSEYDGEGFMDLRSLSGHDGEARTLWFLLQRHYIRQYLNGGRDSVFAPRPLPQAVVLPAVAREALGAALSEGGGLADLMIQQGKVLLARPLPLMRERFLATWQKVHDCLRRSPHLGALSMIWVQETQAEGQDLSVVLAVAERFSQLLAVLGTAIYASVGTES